MEPRYEITSHTADIGLLVRGHSMDELLVNGGHALNAVLFRKPPTRRQLHRIIDVESSGRDALLVDWLNELLYLFEVEHVVFSHFQARDVSDTQARVECEGTHYDPSYHQAALDIKAATYHMAAVRHKGDVLEAEVILDI
ncbi:MAG: archease [Chloroflexota bacterium]